MSASSPHCVTHSTSNISRLFWKTRRTMPGPPFVQQAALYNIEKFFGWVSTVADFCGAIGQAAPTSST